MLVSLQINLKLKLLKPQATPLTYPSLVYVLQYHLDQQVVGQCHTQ